MENFDNNKIKEWIRENLVTKSGAIKITGQSRAAFQQSVRTNMVVPFIEYDESPTVRLYLRSEIEEYARKVAARREIVNKND